jgi:hypothetical protein
VPCTHPEEEHGERGAAPRLGRLLVGLPGETVEAGRAYQLSAVRLSVGSERGVFVRGIGAGRACQLSAGVIVG